MLISQVPLINMRKFASYSKHANVSKHDYIIMKLIILRLNTVNKPSPMSEGVTEIWINNQPCKGINLTTRHTQARRAPRVATIHDVTKKSGRVLPHPSAVFHTYASVDTPWVARTLSYYTPPPKDCKTVVSRRCDTIGRNHIENRAS
jgi:hypothetical protein